MADKRNITLGKRRLFGCTKTCYSSVPEVESLPKCGKYCGDGTGLERGQQGRLAAQ